MTFRFLRMSQFWRRACLDAVFSVNEVIATNSLQSSSGFILAIITVSFDCDTVTLRVKHSFCCRSSGSRCAQQRAGGCTFDGGAWTSTTDHACGSTTDGSPRSCASVAARALCLSHFGRSGFATCTHPVFGHKGIWRMETTSLKIHRHRMR